MIKNKTMKKKKKNVTVTFLCKAIGTYWYTSTQEIQIRCKWFD